LAADGEATNSQKEAGAQIEGLSMRRKGFWILMILLGMIAGVALPFVWAMIAQLPIIVLSWWIAYRSEWFD
jgi:hypothetical protein